MAKTEPSDFEVRAEALKQAVRYLGDSSSRSPRRAMEVSVWFETYLKTGVIT